MELLVGKIQENHKSLFSLLLSLANWSLNHQVDNFFIVELCDYFNMTMPDTPVEIIDLKPFSSLKIDDV